MSIGWYNGWDPDERLATLPVQRAAIKSGALPRPSSCSICGSRQNVWLHDERYDRPLEAYAVCRRCHGALHRRFDDPVPWQTLVAQHSRGGTAWFELLSLDPTCLRRPFSETYPNGLPTSSLRMKALRLSKSRIALYEQCPKRLWLSVYRPDVADDLALEPSSVALGHEVGAIACRFHPDGITIDSAGDWDAAVDATSALLARGWHQPIFEATFAHDGVLIRADLMLPLENGAWHVAEVKSTSGPKDYHLNDLATQLWVIRANGIKVGCASVRHLDREFILAIPGDYGGLLIDTFVDDEIEPLVAAKPATVASARAVLASASEPVREVGSHCDQPWPCNFRGWCSRHLPPPAEWPVDILPGTDGKRVVADWAGRGVADLRSVPANAIKSEKLKRVHSATCSGEPYHDRASIVEETSRWAYPRIYLDFETIQFAVPRWIGTSPFEQVPFQFSAHVEARDGSVAHHCFLSTDGADPRRSCAEALVQLPAIGAVIAWNMSFERGCLKGLAQAFPDLSAALDSLADRLVDLLPVVRRHYYHRDMRGSWSIKAVLPTIAPELAYETLQGVRSGTDAQMAYAEAIDPSTSEPRRETIRQALFDYCERDTFAMMVALQRLSGQAARPLTDYGT